MPAPRARTIRLMRADDHTIPKERYCATYSGIVCAARRTKNNLRQRLVDLYARLHVIFMHVSMSVVS